MSKLPIPFDNPYTYPGHSGIDFPQPRGTIFRASAPGVVTWLGSNLRGGNFIWVRYDSGPSVGYHHMDSHDGCPPVGARFAAGDRLGYVGNSGNSTGPHLHSEVEGHATTAGYWQFFDRDRVVGSGTGAGTSTPTTKEEEDMRVIVINGNYYTIGREYLSHLGSSVQVTEAEAQYGKARQLGSGNAASSAGTKLIGELDLHGVPQYALDAAGRVLNPQSTKTSKYEANGTWSRSREILAKLG